MERSWQAIALALVRAVNGLPEAEHSPAVAKAVGLATFAFDDLSRVDHAAMVNRAERIEAAPNAYSALYVLHEN